MQLFANLETMPSGFYWFFDTRMKSRSIVYWNHPHRYFSLCGDKRKYKATGLAKGIVFAGPVEPEESLLNAVELRAQSPEHKELEVVGGTEYDPQEPQEDMDFLVSDAPKEETTNDSKDSLHQPESEGPEGRRDSVPSSEQQPSKDPFNPFA